MKVSKYLEAKQIMSRINTIQKAVEACNKHQDYGDKINSIVEVVDFKSLKRLVELGIELLREERDVLDDRFIKL